MANKSAIKTMIQLRESGASLHDAAKMLIDQMPAELRKSIEERGGITDPDELIRAFEVATKLADEALINAFMRMVMAPNETHIGMVRVPPLRGNDEGRPTQKMAQA